jgi:hypothetical protein
LANVAIFGEWPGSSFAFAMKPTPGARMMIAASRFAAMRQEKYKSSSRCTGFNDIEWSNLVRDSIGKDPTEA